MSSGIAAEILWSVRDGARLAPAHVRFWLGGDCVHRRNVVRPSENRQRGGGPVVPRTMSCGGTTTSTWWVRPLSSRSMSAVMACSVSSRVFWLTVVRLTWASRAMGLSSYPTTDSSPGMSTRARTKSLDQAHGAANH